MKENILREIMNHIGDFPEVHEQVKYWINLIEEQGVRICTRGDQSASSYDNRINDESCVIRISTRHDASKGIRLLWDLLHEYGHHLDKDPSNKRRTPREIRAWEIARGLLKNESQYTFQEADFNSHMNKNLESYRSEDLSRFHKRQCKVTLINGTVHSGAYQTYDAKKRTFCLKHDAANYGFYPLDEIQNVMP